MKTKLILSIAITSVLALSACFKSEPKREMMRAAGAWEISKVEYQEFDSLGNQVVNKSAEGIGVLMLNHYDDFLYEGSNSIQINPGYTEWDTDISKTLAGDNRIWWLSVDAKQLGLGHYDPETGYVTTVRQYTVTKLTNKKFEFFNVIQQNNDRVKSIEKWYMKRY